MGRVNFCRCKNTPMSRAGPTRSQGAPPCSAGAKSIARLASSQINCTSAMTPAISTQRRKTSLEIAKFRRADELASRRLIRRQPTEGVRLHGQHAVGQAALDDIDGVFSVTRSHRDQQRQKMFFGGMRALGVR